LGKIVSDVFEEGMNIEIEGRKRVRKTALPSAASEAIVLPPLRGSFL